MQYLTWLTRWLNGKEPTCPFRRCRFNPWVGKIPWEGNDNPLEYSCLGIPQTEEHGGLLSVGSQRIRLGWATKPHTTNAWLRATHIFSLFKKVYLLLFLILVPEQGAIMMIYPFCFSHGSLYRSTVLTCGTSDFLKTNGKVKFCKLHMNGICHSLAHVCTVTSVVLTLWGPMNSSLPGNSIHEISQARIPYWVAMPSS